MKLNLGSGNHPLKGFTNLDKLDGWYFEDGLPYYGDGSVEAITISHALMFVPIEHWSAVFKEFYRVIENEGVIRITEDATDDPDSPRYGGHHDAVTLTSRQLVAKHLTEAGFAAVRRSPDETLFKDTSLIQEWHGQPPKVFHFEGLRCSRE